MDAACWEFAGMGNRIILDVRYVNKCLAQYKFKLKDLETVARVYEKRDSIVTSYRICFRVP